MREWLSPLVKRSVRKRCAPPGLRFCHLPFAICHPVFFPVLYFDHNATHPLSPRAREVWLDATERYIGNPSSLHRLGARADRALNEAREKLAGWLGCEPAEIVWTSGATEANNAVIHHAAATGEGKAWVSAIEHPCVLEAVDRYFTGRQRFIPVDREGVAEVGWLAEALKNERPVLVGTMAANNETGVLQPWREVMALCQEHSVPFFCDAAQWLGKLPASGLGGCAFVSGCGHKFGGPQGVGFLKVPAIFQPLIVGGPQEEGRRAGTENVAGILAMIAALEERETGLAALAERTAIRERFEAALVEALPGIQILGSVTERLWNTVSAVMPQLPDCRQRWVVKLDKLGFAVSTGSACASGKEQTSHVLAAMGLSSEAASRVLRFSSGWNTTEEDWKSLINGISQAFFELSQEKLA
jgi:cysteine desulfurase